MNGVPPLLLMAPSIYRGWPRSGQSWNLHNFSRVGLVWVFRRMLSRERISEIRRHFCRVERVQLAAEVVGAATRVVDLGLAREGLPTATTVLSFQTDHLRLLINVLFRLLLRNCSLVKAWMDVGVAMAQSAAAPIPLFFDDLTRFLTDLRPEFHHFLSVVCSDRELVLMQLLVEATVPVQIVLGHRVDNICTNS